MHILSRECQGTRSLQVEDTWIALSLHQDAPDHAETFVRNSHPKDHEDIIAEAGT